MAVIDFKKEAEYRKYDSANFNKQLSPTSTKHSRAIMDTKGGDDMADEWMKQLIQKIDDDQKEAERIRREDQRELEERLQKSIDEANVRHEKTFTEIKAIMNRLEDKIEAGIKENKSILRQTMLWTIGTVIAIVAMAITMFIGLIQIALAIV